MTTQRFGDRGLPEEPAFPSREGPYLFLLDATGRLEKEILLGWLDRRRPAEDQARIDWARIPNSRRAVPRRRVDPRLDARLAEDDDPLLIPLRVVWRAPERDGRRRVRLGDILTLGDPRDPNWLLQRFTLTSHPERVHVVVGEPARKSELVERWKVPRGRGPSDGTMLAEYVAVQAGLALERAERGLRGNRYKVPKFLREDLYDSRQFQQGVARLAMQAGTPLRRMQQRTARYLKEIAATHSPYVIDLVTGVTGWLISRAHKELEYSQDELNAVYDLGQRYTLVFLPSHKSNFDHLVLQYLLYENELPPNHTAGGINMNFFPVGPFLRRSGIFFIRREFADNEPYKFVLRQYVDYLIEKRFPLEWYIEGGRSRSGKMREPRMGLLAYVVDAYRRGLSGDVVIVPVSIAYDQISDVKSYAAEQRGEEKERESFAWLLKFVGRLAHSFGGIHVRFGEPISLRERIDRSVPAEEDRLTVPKLAFEVCTRINAATPITPTSLVTLALLSRGARALTVDETLGVLEPFLEYVKRRDLPISVPLGLDTPEQVREALDALASNGVVARNEGPTEIVYGIGHEQHLAAAYYRNTIIHFFVTGAITELALAEMVAAGATSEAALTERALALRDLFKFEFFFAERDEWLTSVHREMRLARPGWEELLQERDTDSVLAAFEPFKSPAVLRPFLEAYLTVADVLAAAPPLATVTSEQIERDALGLGRQYMMQGRIVNDEAVSTALFSAAIKLAGNRALLEGTPEMIEARPAFAAEVRGHLQRLNFLVGLEAMAGGDYSGAARTI